MASEGCRLVDFLVREHQLLRRTPPKRLQWGQDQGIEANRRGFSIIAAEVVSRSSLTRISNMPARPTSTAGFSIAPLDQPTIQQLAASLAPEERLVILNQGTEPPFCGNLLDTKRDGTYVCRLCGLPLFRSTAKFDSGTGWPSFFAPFDPEHVREIEDHSHGMRRVEIRCTRCDGHLGHVFPDGPPPTHLRYCLNSVALEFVDEGEPFPEKVGAPITEPG